MSRLRPQETKVEGRIINTLLESKHRGLAENTLRCVSYSLKQLSRNADLNNPISVKEHIANRNVANSTKTRLCFAYDLYCKTNKIQWEKPRYKWERKIPIIPTTANVDKIISASTPKFATIFTILKETGLECCELSSMTRQFIDTERGIISAQGCKGHNSRSIKLKAKTAEMLRRYLAKNPQEYPFPQPKVMSQIWRRTRNKLAHNLQQPHLAKIPMKNLRNYSGAQLYYKLLDPIAVMRHLRHKKLETTMHYIRGIPTGTEEEYVCKTASNVKEATDLIENGFEYIQEIDGIRLYRKRK